MKKSAKLVFTILIINLLLIININAATANISKTTKVPTIFMQDVDYVWIVVNFNFSCEERDYHNRTEASFKYTWKGKANRGTKAGRVRVDCFRKSMKNNEVPLRGFVVKLPRDDRYRPISNLQIEVQNCTRSDIYTTEPDEWEMKEFVQITYSQTK